MPPSAHLQLTQKRHVRRCHTFCPSSAPAVCCTYPTLQEKIQVELWKQSREQHVSFQAFTNKKQNKKTLQFKSLGGIGCFEVPYAHQSFKLDDFLGSKIQ